MKKEINPPDPKVTSGSHVSAWLDGVSPISYPPLRENIETDVVVVGGGIAGVSIAYHLTRAGKSVALVEDGNIGSGETGRTTAHLVTALDDRYFYLEKLFGKEKTNLLAQSHRMAIESIANIVEREGIDCDFERVSGYLMIHPSDKPESLEKELTATHNAGLNVYEVEAAPGIINGSGRCLCFPDQAQFHPMKYLAALCRAIEQNGGRIFTSTRATRIDHTGVGVDGGFDIKAKDVVVATNTPINNIFTMHLKQYAYRTYVIGAKVKKNTVPHALWWDTGDHEANPKTPPYHYVRLTPYNDEFDILICGGEDHETGKDISHKDPYIALESWMRRYFPVEPEEIVYRWSGQVMEPMDGVAYIGHNPLDHKNVYIVTGDSGNGMTHGPLAGLLITDLITGKKNPFQEIYSPWRISLRETGSMFSQMMREYLSYLKQWPGFKSAKALREVANGEGKLVDINEEKYGVYRDETGSLHIVSAECTHLKCTVSWNADERSWDCPCHGSRFSYEGQVLNGPAASDLPSFSESRDKDGEQQLIRKPGG